MKLTTTALALVALAGAPLRHSARQTAAAADRPRHAAAAGQRPKPKGRSIKPSEQGAEGDRRAADSGERERRREHPGQGRGGAGGREDQGGPLPDRAAAAQGGAGGQGQCRDGGGDRCDRRVGLCSTRRSSPTALQQPRRHLLQRQAIRSGRRSASSKALALDPHNIRSARSCSPRRAASQGRKAEARGAASSARSRRPPPPARSREEASTSARSALAYEAKLAGCGRARPPVGRGLSEPDSWHNAIAIYRNLDEARRRGHARPAAADAGHRRADRAGRLQRSMRARRPSRPITTRPRRCSTQGSRPSMIDPTEPAFTRHRSPA